MNPIRNAVIEHIQTCHENGNQARGDELGQEEPRLSVSQIGHCPRAAILDAVRYHPDHPLHVDPTHPFDDYVQEIMEAGNVWECQTGKALARRLGDKVHWKRDDPALRVGNEHWSGHIDFLVEPCDEFPAGAVIEHKATNPTVTGTSTRASQRISKSANQQISESASQRWMASGRQPSSTLSGARGLTERETSLTLPWQPGSSPAPAGTFATTTR